MEEKKIPQIIEGYTNIYGTHHDKVREIAYKQGELFGRLGKYVTETKYNTNEWFGSSFNRTNGVYIYQSYNNPEVAYRIYKTFADPGFNGYSDDILIQRLVEKQPGVKLSQFPTGVVTLEKRIIGQEIPFFHNSITINEYITKNKDVHPFEIYLKILDILYELYQNGIVYLDNHANNFMINPKDNNKINIIDFDITYVKFDDHPAELRRLFENYRTMIDNLNKILGIYGIIGRFEPAPNFIDTYQELNYLSKTLKRIK